MKKCRNLFLMAVFAVIMTSLFIPYNRQPEVLVKREITANYPFAGDIMYHGERIGASGELCALLWVGDLDDTIQVIREDYVFFTRRVPI